MTWLARLLGGVGWPLLAAAALLAMSLLTLRQCETARQAGREASLSAETGKAVQDSAVDAIGAVGAVSGRNSASDAMTMENRDAILSAPGADQRLDPRVRSAGLDSLCRRAAYRCTPDCVQRAVAAGVANAGAGCAAAGR